MSNGTSSSKTSMDISVVVPVYMNERGLREFYKRVKTVLESMGRSWEIVMVDDGSKDGSYGVMQELRNGDKRVKIIQFGHNHGQHHAILCGLQHSAGDIVITLDDDLQNPPEEIPRFVDMVRQGHDVVIGRIADKKKHTWFRNFGSRSIQAMTSIILGKPKNLSFSSYRAMSRQAVDAISTYKGVHPYLPALILNSVPTASMTNIDVRHDVRFQGRSTYSLRKLIKLASYLLINHSYIPLRFMIIWGICLSFGSLVYALYIIGIVLLRGSHGVLGWSSMAVLVSFLSGNILLALGILGEYIGRLVQESATNLQFYVFRKDL